MSTRERICALEMRRGGLLLTTLRTAEGVRHVRELDAPNLPPADSRMLDIAGKLIEQQAGDFDPSEFKQRYEDALRALIQQKAKGRPVRPTFEAERNEKVIDLMEALRKSLGRDRAEAACPESPQGGRKRAA